MSKHTPRRWKVGDEYSYGSQVIDAESGCGVAWCGLNTIFSKRGEAVRSDPKAFARLIAKAPETETERDGLKKLNAEMLEALEVAKNTLSSNGLCVGYSDFDQVCKAIAKAKGDYAEFDRIFKESAKAHGKESVVGESEFAWRNQ